MTDTPDDLDLDTLPDLADAPIVEPEPEPDPHPDPDP
jgi:hypothetical protein